VTKSQAQTGKLVRKVAGDAKGRSKERGKWSVTPYSEGKRVMCEQVSFLILFKLEICLFF
jgi:hypothetical protein